MADASAQAQFWKDHYDSLATRAESWLDYGNERVQEQSLELAVRAGTPLAGVRCIDVGCGRGQLSLILSQGGAAEVVGVDASPALIRRLTAEQPGIRWLDLDIGALATVSLGSFERVFAIEVLQYVPLVQALHRLWELTSPGGRMIGIVPNRDCPFLAGAIERFGGHYAPPRRIELEGALRTLAAVAGVEMRGMWYTQQPAGPPYRVSELPAVGVAEPPNRFLFSVDRAADP